MIPFSQNPIFSDVGLPPKVQSLVENFMAMRDTDHVEFLSPDDLLGLEAFIEPQGYMENLNPVEEVPDEDKFRGVLLKNCKLSGCDADCARYHHVDADCARDHHIDTVSICSDDILVNPNEMFNIMGAKEPKDDIPLYTPDDDHSYYATAPMEKKQTVTEPDSKLDVLKMFPIHPMLCSKTSSEDDIDVVTIDQFHAPVISKYDYLPRRSSRSLKCKTKNTQRTQKMQVSARALKAAMKRTGINSVSRRIYRPRKLNNSVETTPNSSTPCSGHSSHCNSDDEDIDKRKTHNSSERKRREAQRFALQNLRCVIPDLQNNPKAPKVLILNTATSLVKKLKQNKKTLKELKRREKHKKKELLAKLQALRMKLKR